MRIATCLIAFVFTVGTLGCSEKKGQDPTAGDGPTDGAAAPEAPSAPEATPSPKTGGDKIAARSSSDSSQLDVSYITGDFYGAWVLNVEQILHHKPLADLMDRKALQRPIEKSGIDPRDLEQALVLAGLPVGEMKVQPGFIFRFSDDSAAQAFTESFKSNQNVESVDLEGTQYWRNEETTEPSLFVAPDGTTVILAIDSTLQKMIVLEGEAQTELVAELKQMETASDAFGVIVIEPVRGLVKRAMASAPDRLPSQVAMYADLVDHLKSARLTINLSDNQLAKLELQAVRSESVAKLQEAATANIAMAKLMFNGMRQQLSREAPPEAMAIMTQVSQMLDTLKAETIDSNTVVAHLTAPDGLVEKLAAALGPALDQAQSAAQRMHVSNNAKQIAIAQYNHHDAFNGFAADTVTEDGTRTLSWRVHLLPFIEESALHEQFHLDEPWDSPHNQALVEQMPDVYGSPGEDQNNAQGLTRFQSFRGNGALQEPRNQPVKRLSDRTIGVRVAQIADGTSNSIMFVRTPPEKAVPWTKPADIEFDPEAPLENLGQIPPDGLLVALCDTSVRIIKNVTPDLLKKLVTIHGGESLPPQF